MTDIGLVLNTFCDIGYNISPYKKGLSTQGQGRLNTKMPVETR